MRARLRRIMGKNGSLLGVGGGGGDDGLGEDILNTAPHTLNTSDEVVENFSSNSDNDFSYQLTAVGTSSSYPRIETALTEETVIGQLYRFSFMAVVVGEPVITTLRFGGTQTVINFTIVNGYNEFDFEAISVGVACRWYMNGANRGLSNVNVEGYTCRKVLGALRVVDLDGDGNPDTVLTDNANVTVTEDIDSVNVDDDGDGIADRIYDK